MKHLHTEYQRKIKYPCTQYTQDPQHLLPPPVGLAQTDGSPEQDADGESAKKAGQVSKDVRPFVTRTQPREQNRRANHRR